MLCVPIYTFVDACCGYINSQLCTLEIKHSGYCKLSIFSSFSSRDYLPPFTYIIFHFSILIRSANKTWCNNYKTKLKKGSASPPPFSALVSTYLKGFIFLETKIVFSLCKHTGHSELN